MSERDRLARRLAGLDRDQTQALLERLLDGAPELADRVYLTFPGECHRADPRLVRGQVAHILRTMGDDWQASSRAERALWPLVEIGTRYLDNGEVADARTVFGAVATAILADYEQIRDEESEVAGIVGRCVEGLGRCLAGSTDPAVRRALLHDVFEVYRWDALDHGGYGMADVPRRLLVEATSPAERRLVAEWVRAALPVEAAGFGRWRRQDGGRLVLALVGSELDEAERERLFVMTELDRPRLDLLLAQGRRREAVELVRNTSGDGLLALAERLMAGGVADEARAAVRDHPAVLESRNHRVRDWLVRQGVALPPDLDALVGDVLRFQARPTLRAYQQLRQAAVAAGRWPLALRAVGPLDPDLKGLRALRARVQAELGDATGALAELEGLDGSAWRSAAADVAGAFERDHPGLAVDLLRRLVSALLAHGTKPARLQAAELGERLSALEARQAQAEPDRGWVLRGRGRRTTPASTLTAHHPHAPHGGPVGSW